MQDTTTSIQKGPVVRGRSPTDSRTAPNSAFVQGTMAEMGDIYISRFGDGKPIRSNKDQTIYVGMTDPTNRLAIKEKGQKKKKGAREKD